MLCDFSPDGFSFALGKGRTLGHSVVAVRVVALNLVVTQDLRAAHFSVVADELHRHKFLFYLFLDADKARLGAHHRALPCLFRELVQAHLVEATVALFTLPGLDQNSLAQCAKQVLAHLLRPSKNVPSVHRKRHSLEVYL